MAEREFLIQRYSTANWEYVRGHLPFVATGPAFRHFVVPGSIDRYGEYRFTSGIRAAVEEIQDGGDWREAVAEWLLREGIIQALWSVDVDTCIPEDLRWEASVMGVALEIPKSMPLAEATIELLSGLSGAEHFRSYLSEDELTLEPVAVPGV